MKAMAARRWRGLGLLAIGALLLTSASAGADDWRRGRAMVDSVDPLGRTVTIDDVVYDVPVNCRIRRESGASVSLGDLRGGADAGPLVAIDEIDFVSFEAMPAGRGWRMVEMIVLDEPTE